MKLTKCENGHFYDAEKFSSCPHCSGGNAQGGVGEDKKTDCLMPNQGAARTDDFEVTRDGLSAPDYGRDGNQAGERVTVPFNDWKRNFQAVDGIASGGAVNQDVRSDDDENKTVAYMNWQNADEKDKPQYINKAVQQRSGQPVVGWLVCIKGSNYGNSFILFGGKNFIGRSSDMDICLAGDNTVARVKHAIIIYEPKERKFFAQPGESHELFYLNDSVVLNNVELNDRDVISVGKTQLVFVPFCDERYGWEK